MAQANKNEFRSGFAGIVGPTNSGKSTLLNQLIGRKVSIVSPKVQTTYHQVRGILQKKESQTIFTDTPGFQNHPERVARLLNKVADKNAKDSDLLLWVFDVSSPRVRVQIERLSKKIEAMGSPETRMLILNKVDKVKKEDLLPLIAEMAEKKLFCEIIPISAKTGSGVDHVLAEVQKRLPEGPAMYDPASVTDRPERFQIAELIREKIYQATHQEIPYSAWVEIEDWEAANSKVPTIQARLHVDADSRKAILIGKKGEMLKRIGILARKDIEKLVGHQICLKLHVDVHEDWKSDSRHLTNYLELE